VPLPEPRRHQLYWLTGSSGELLYVGISYSAIARMAQHKTEKTWWNDVVNIQIDDLGEITRQEAEERERYIIMTERPLHNVVHNGKTSTARPAKAQNRDGVVGYFVLPPDDDPAFPTHQGHIIDDLGGGMLLIQWFSWMTGAPTSSSIVPMDSMVAWRLYASEEAFHEAGERDTKRRDREQDRRLREREIAERGQRAPA
jgi:predicted GIY-YIG superfamily endonuclease